MLTNNFYQVLRANMSQKSVGSGIIDTSGNARNASYSSQGMSYLFNAFSSPSNKGLTSQSLAGGIAFGTGDTPPTLNDYWLSGDLITTVGIVAVTITTAIANGVYTFVNAITVNNTGSDSIVINEMAIIPYVYYSGSSQVPAVVERQVLDTPLTLAPGEQGVITYTFNLPIVQ